MTASISTRSKSRSASVSGDCSSGYAAVYEYGMGKYPLRKADATDEEVIAAAKLANADGFIRRLPDGYQTKLTNNGANLSQGRDSFVYRPCSGSGSAGADPDEATSSIDTRTRSWYQDGMDKLMHGFPPLSSSPTACPP